jgi:anionic cell wall polymer biosynthesis LytR-Cps2A-Psr (LCP) family protein
MGVSITDVKFQHDQGKRSEFDWISILLILLALGIIVGIVFFIFHLRESEIEGLLNSGSTLEMILVEKNGESTEAILLSYYNPATNKQAFIILPSITRLKVEYRDKPAYDIIQNIYTRGGISIVKKAVEKLTGSEFKYYLVYDLKDVEKLIDLIEGIEVVNQTNLRYNDVAKKLFINIPSGKNLLDGAKVKQLLLYKYDQDGMKAYVENHRVFLEALLLRAMDLEKLFSDRRRAHVLMNNIDTNLSTKDMRILAHEMSKVNSSKLSFYRMQARTVSIDNENFLVPVEGGKWLKEGIEDVRKFINDEGPAPIGDEIKIEILNGSMNPGQAQSLRNYFLEYGFNVVHYGNAMRNDYEKTIVIDRIGRPSLARRIADIINCKEVYTRIDKTLLVDVTIIIGNDFEGKYVR